MSGEGFAFSADRILAALDFSSTAANAEKAHRREVETLLSGMMDTVDALETLERKLQTAGGRDGSRSNRTTVRRIVRNLLQVLHQAGVAPVNCVGRPIDLDQSEVVEVRYDTGAAEDTVVEEIVRGYTLRQRPFRRARVIIAGKRCDDPLTTASTSTVSKKRVAKK